MWYASDQALATRSATMAACHIGLGPSFINKDQTRGVNPALIPLPEGALAGDGGAFLLGRAQRFF